MEFHAGIGWLVQFWTLNERELLLFCRSAYASVASSNAHASASALTAKSGSSGGGAVAEEGLESNDQLAMHAALWVGATDFYCGRLRD